jgi:uncharacterized protein
VTTSDDPDAGALWWSRAHIAVEQLDLQLLARLLCEGADVHDADVYGFTLLHHAIDAEADSATQTGEPLHAHMTALLLAHGADPTVTDARGWTPADLARQMHHYIAVGLFDAWLAEGSRK